MQKSGSIRIQYRWRYIGTAGLILVFTAVVFFGAFWCDSLKKNTRRLLETRLFAKSPEGILNPWDKPDKHEAGIYVLGGTHDSLVWKFGMASKLYQQGWANVILVMHSDALTAYDSALGRNLTDNEWAIKQLTGLGVAEKDIEFVKIESGYFGTLSEARTLRKVVAKKGIQHLMLVCSAYHGKRVWVSFSALIEGTGAKIEIWGADERMRICGLLVEYGKLLLYEHLLIPYKLWANHRKEHVLAGLQIKEVNG